MILSAKFRGSRCRCHSLSCLWFFPYHCPSKSSKVDGAKKNRSQIASFKKNLLSNLLNINQMLKRGQVSSLMQLQPSYVWSLDWFLLLLDQLQLHETQKILYNSISCLHLPKESLPKCFGFFLAQFRDLPNLPQSINGTIEASSTTSSPCHVLYLSSWCCHGPGCFIPGGLVIPPRDRKHFIAHYLWVPIYNYTLYVIYIYILCHTTVHGSFGMVR